MLITNITFGYNYFLYFDISEDFYDEFRHEVKQNITTLVNIVLKHTASSRHYKYWKRVAFEDIFVKDDLHYPVNVSNVAQKLLEVSEKQKCII